MIHLNVGRKFFSTLVIKSGYQLVPLDEDLKFKTGLMLLVLTGNLKWFLPDFATLLVSFKR